MTAHETPPGEPPPVAVDVRRAAGRAVGRTSWLDSRRSFSFGEHYDPRNTHFGLLLANNDDVLAPGAGFPMHPHQDIEIVTWVLEGRLAHEDSAGYAGTIAPGTVQRVSAGTGIRHAERNATERGPVRFVQMWVVPDGTRRPPSYEQRDVSAELAGGGLVTVVSAAARHRSAISIRQQDAALHVARLAAGEAVSLPATPYLHVYVAVGAVDLESAGRLAAGDAARLLAADGPRLAAVEGPAEVLVWEMQRAL